MVGSHVRAAARLSWFPTYARHAAARTQCTVREESHPSQSMPCASCSKPRDFAEASARPNKGCEGWRTCWQCRCSWPSSSTASSYV